jgi:cytidine deaminase/uncharacterized protein YqfB (UPF0267 family)
MRPVPSQLSPEWRPGRPNIASVNAPLPPSARELDASEVELVELARQTIDATTDAAPGEGGIHTMGAAVRAEDGLVYTGVNLYHFTGGPCAELVALAAARAQGARRITHIVAVGNHGRGPAAPCGRDRQVLIDYYPGIRVIVPTAEGLRSVAAEDLIPFAYVQPSATEQHPVQTIYFNPRYLDAVRSGQKTRTTRFRDPARMGAAVLEFELEPAPVRLMAKVTDIRETTFAALTDDDAQHEALETADQLRQALRSHYPMIAPNDQVQVVSFQLA